MPNKQNNLSPEEIAKLEQIRAARMAAIKQGIDNLKNGQHRALEQLGFLNTETTDLADLSEEDLAKTKALFAQAFGLAPEDPTKGLMENLGLLNRFTFRRSPQNRPWEIADVVREQLRHSPKFAGRELRDAELLPYVQAELLRQMARPGSQLTYDDGKGKNRKHLRPRGTPGGGAGGEARRHPGPKQSEWQKVLPAPAGAEADAGRCL